MQYLLEHFGVTVGAITGVLAARGKQVDLFGVIVLALVTAFGGGTVRDVLLDCPVFWVADPNFLLNGVLTAVILFYAVRFHNLPGTFLLVADAFVLAFFTIVGTRKGLVFDTGPSVAILMGVTTGVAGGLLRDVMLGELPLVFRREIYLYATAAFFGAAIYVAIRKVNPNVPYNMVIGTAATLLLRLAGIKWRIALPMFRPKEYAGES